MTLSIGVASFPEDADNAEALISVADEALYQAKREGRDRAVRARKLKKTGS
jgi:diguanylate cyclase (GGDEF)-like protein